MIATQAEEGGAQGSLSTCTPPSHAAHVAQKRSRAGAPTALADEQASHQYHA